MANLKHAEHDPKRVEMSGEVLEPCPQNPAVTASSAARVDLVEVPCVIPSFAAASELVSAPYSCLVMNTRRRHVVLPPMYLHKKRTALREELQAELLKFSPSLQGVPLSYDNIQIVRSHGDIYDDSGYIHMDIQANFIIFQPQEGQRLLGKVNKLGVSHVGCLVHGCFNASIPKPNLVSVDTWRDAGPRIGAELEFEVVALDADTAGVLLIRGRLNRTRVQELLAITESSDSGVAVDDQVESEDMQPVTEATEESVDHDATKKKKKKKKKEKIKEEEEAASPSCQLDGNGTESEANDKKKKKKKKEKIKEEEEVKEEEAASPSCQLDGNGTESEANDEKKKEKKKKRDKLKDVMEEMSPSRQDGGNAKLELNGTESDANAEKKKKKKMKKEKRIKEEEEEEPVRISPTEIHASDSSGYHSDKPDKRKREKEIQVIASFSQEAFEPKSKKKKKENDIA